MKGKVIANNLNIAESAGQNKALYLLTRDGSGSVIRIDELLNLPNWRDEFNKKMKIFEKNLKIFKTELVKIEIADAPTTN